MIKRFLLAALLLTCGSANAQLYSKFGPVTGVLKGNVASPQTSNAIASDITALWTSCSGSNFLRGDGVCAVPAGTGVTSVGASFAGSWYTVSGSPVTTTGTLAFGLTTGLTANSFLATPNGSTGTLSLRTVVLADLPTITVAKGGTGLVTLPAHGVLLGEGTSNVGNVAAMAADTLLQGQGVSADPVAVAVNNCGSSTTALSYSTSTHTFGCQTISSGTGSVTSVGSGTGVTASPNPIIATGTLAVDQAFSPTWTGTHTYSFAPVFNAGFAGSASLTTALSGSLTNPNAGAGASVDFRVSNGTNTHFNTLTGTGFSGVFFSGGPTGQQIAIGTSANIPMALGAGGHTAMVLQSTGITGFGTVANAQVDMSPDSSTFTMTYTGYASPPTCTASWARVGKLVVLSFCIASATSNANTLTATGIPAAIRPTTTQFMGPSCPSLTDNGAGIVVTCAVSVNSSGVATFFNIGNPNGWTITGSKGVNSVITVTYGLY